MARAGPASPGRTLGDSDTGALGLTYVNSHWSDSTSWSLGRTPMPDEYTGGNTHGKVQWDALMVSYRFGVPLAPRLAFIIEPRLGAARARAHSGTVSARRSISSIQPTSIFPQEIVRVQFLQRLLHEQAVLADQLPVEPDLAAAIIRALNAHHI